MCDGDASDYDSVMSMLVGEESALEYRKGLQEAGDLGGGVETTRLKEDNVRE